MEIFMLAGSAALFLITGVILLFKNIQFVKGALKTTGEIVDITEYYDTTSGGKTRMYTGIIEFFTLNNEPVRISNSSSSNRKPKIGKKLEIYYYEEKPESAKVASVFVLYIVPPLLIVLGIFLFFLTWKVAQG